MRIQAMRLNERAPDCWYITAGASGMDLAYDGTVELSFLPGERCLISTGWAFAIPEGYEGQIRPRSGLALRNGVFTVLGTIDSDYRGEVKVLLVNAGQDLCTVKPGDRVAQLVIAPVVRAEVELVSELPPTARGASGFGSTGR